MPRVTRFLFLLVFAVALFAQASTAIAAPAQWSSVDVTLQSAEQQSMLLVSGELPVDAKLPAEAELAVPAGTQIQWIGEVLGGDPSKDPELKYTKTSANGVDLYRFTLTKGRVAQVEGTVPGMSSFDGTNYVTGLKWTAWQAVPVVRISQRIPAGAQIVQAAEGASVQPGSAGYNYYTKTVTSPKAGDVIELAFSYAPGAAGAGASGVGASSSTSAVTIVFGIVAVIGFMALLVRSQKKRPAGTVDHSQFAFDESDNDTHVAPPKSKQNASRRKQPEPDPEPVPAKRKNLALPTLVVVGAVIAVAIIAGATTNSGDIVNGTLTRDFGAPSACQSTSLPFTANQGVDLAQQGEKLLEAFEGMDGVGVVTIDLAQSKVDMEWCESSQSEESMRQALSVPGLITLGQSVSSAPAVATAAATTATADASGTKQTAAVDTASGSFSPAQIVLKAGVPAEIAFGKAEGCLTEVVIDGLGITQDLTQGPVTVKLPALDAGTYAFACAMGHQGGQIVVQ